MPDHRAVAIQQRTARAKGRSANRAAHLPCTIIRGPPRIISRGLSWHQPPRDTHWHSQLTLLLHQVGRTPRTISQLSQLQFFGLETPQPRHCRLWASHTHRWKKSARNRFQLLPLAGSRNILDRHHSLAVLRQTTILTARSPLPSSSFHTHYSTPINLLPLERHPYNMSSRPSQSSPLSPTAPAQPINIPRPHDLQSGGLQPDHRPKHRARPAAQNLNLNLAGLPKYHPANFPTSGDNTPLSPRSIQALSTTSKRNTRTGSDAQHALHKYQREIVTRASGFSSELAKPTSPRLIPEGSPAGSMTPLALEAQSDYLLAASNLPTNAADARKIVDQILQKENEERVHPAARRERSRSPAVTPPV